MWTMDMIYEDDRHSLSSLPFFFFWESKTFFFFFFFFFFLSPEHLIFGCCLKRLWISVNNASNTPVDCQAMAIYGNFYIMRISIWVGCRKGTINWEFTALIKTFYKPSVVFDWWESENEPVHLISGWSMNRLWILSPNSACNTPVDCQAKAIYGNFYIMRVSIWVRGRN